MLLIKLLGYSIMAGSLLVKFSQIIKNQTKSTRRWSKHLFIVNHVAGDFWFNGLWLHSGISNVN
jgi:hypothetical protein